MADRLPGGHRDWPADSLPRGDPRIASANDAARVHVGAALPHVVGDHYMVEHWLAAYAVLLVT